MKKVILTITIIFSIFFINNNYNKNISFAQNIEDGMVEVKTSDLFTLMPQKFTTQSAKVNYELPYPGMLPDNPFYTFKVIRDKIVRILINDSFQEAKFNLLTSQKRFFAGKLLVDKKKYSLALETIEKSNNYLLDALDAIKKEKKENPKSVDVLPFLDQLKTVTLKYTEILEELELRVGDVNKEKIKWQEKRVENIRKNVEDLLSKK